MEKTAVSPLNALNCIETVSDNYDFIHNLHWSEANQRDRGSHNWPDKRRLVTESLHKQLNQKTQ